MTLIEQIDSTKVFEPKKPLPLIQKKLPIPDYPLHALGETLGNAAISISECVQCPQSMAGQSVLAAASLAVQAFADVIIDGRSYPLSLFCLTIAGSGDRKSGADNLALKAHNKLQKEWMREYQQEKDTFQCAMAAYEIAIKKTKSEKKFSQDELTDALNEIPKPLAPIAPYLIAQEPTLEGLQKSFDRGRSSQGLFNDEGGQFFGGHAMSSDNALKSMAGLSKFWDGKDIIRTRAGDDESMALFGKRLCVHLMIQPIVAGKVLGDPILQGQGFLPRFLLSWSESIAGTRLYNYKDATQEPALLHYWDVIQACLNEPLPDEKHPPRTIPLSPEAKDFWVKSYNAIESALSEEGKLTEIKATASKAAENIARIAGVLALIDNLEAYEIELKHIEQAVNLEQYYLNEALRLNKTDSQSDDLNNAQTLLDWMKLQQSKLFSLRQVTRNGPRGSGIRKGKAAAQKLITTLVEHNWLTNLPDGALIDGKHCSDVWRLNDV